VKWMVSAVLVLGAWTSALAYGADRREAAPRPQREIRVAKNDTGTARRLIEEEREKLTRELALLKAEVARGEEALQASKAQFERLRAKEDVLRRELSREEAHVQALEETLRIVAQDAQLMLSESLITPENPSRAAGLKPLLDPSRFPSLADVQYLVEVLFTEMEASGSIRRRKGEFIDLQGREVTGEIVRVGKFVACYRAGDAVGYLRYDKHSQKMMAVSGSLPWGVQRSLRRYLSAKSDHLPLDLSGGAVFVQMSHERGMWEWLESGGPLVWPILLVGLVALLLMAERLCVLARIPAATDHIMEQVHELASRADWEGCRRLCLANSRAPTSKVLLAGFEHPGCTREVLENGIEEAVLKEIPRLERFLPTLAVLAAVAPLLGLLGTVTGMIETFQVITLFGTGDTRLMSGGISEALVTTQLGLAVAVPIMLAHHFFERRVDKIVGDMDEKSVALTATLVREGYVDEPVAQHAA